MRHYSNNTTARLEAYGRARNLTVGIVISPDNSAGRYFIVRTDGRVHSRWISLGWTIADAKRSIAGLAAGHPVTPSQSGYCYHAE